MEKLLQPFLEVTIALESVRPKGSRIFAYFLYLLRSTHYSSSLPLESIREVITKRFDMIYKDIMAIAYICDPLAQEERPVVLTQKMRVGVQKFLLQHYQENRERAGRVWSELCDILARRGIWASEVNWESFKHKRDPAEWWNDQDCSQDLKDLAIHALSINPNLRASRT